jgi:hypothetical protein
MSTSRSALARPVAVALLVALLGAVLLPGSSVASPERRGEERVSAAGVLHRLVWAEPSTRLRNLHLRSSRLDGSDARRMFDHPRGFTLTLVPDGRGRRVAFGTCCRDDMPQLVVAPVLGGPHLEPIAGHPELTEVDGIGWSPDGRSLAFQAITDRDGVRTSSIWTVRLDGSDLREVLTLGDVTAEGVGTDATMAWTRAGILYTDGEDLRLARDQASRLVMRGVRSVQVSRDGHRLVLGRTRGDRAQVWITRSDGTRARKVLEWPTGAATYYFGVTPNQDATRLLAHRTLARDHRAESAWVAWDVADGAGSAEVLPLDDGASAVAWN